MEDKNELKRRLSTTRADFDKAIRGLLIIGDRIHAEDYFDLAIKSRRLRSEIERLLSEADRKVARA